MSARVHSESARRISDCVTALLREQPFFGSLALRLPIRADASRETVASDGRDIRYSPRWIADAQAHVIKTAMARVVLACALKHHTRRGERDPRALAVCVPAGNARPAEGRGVHPAARRRGLGRHQRRAGL